MVWSLFPPSFPSKRNHLPPASTRIMELWEALDVDDSDLTSFFPPNSNFPPLNQTLTLAQTSFPLPLQPCSQLSRPSQSQSQSCPSLTLISPPPPPPPTEVPAPNKRRRIPGPVGAVQAAMHRQIANPPPYSPHCLRISQEGISVDNEDFKKNPWLSALHFLGVESDLGMSSLLLCSIKTSHATKRIPQVVGVITSCKPNGLGDLIVNLKDPSGMVSATIHRKVLSDSKFTGDISVGSVIILQQVVVFSVAHSIRYLNVTVNNVVKVFSKDIGPPPKQKFLARPTKCVDSEARSIIAEEKTSVGQTADSVANVELSKEVCYDESMVEKGKTVCAARSRSFSNNNVCIAFEETNHETRGGNGAKKLLSGWTDEQLNELFADFEDC